MGSVPIIDLTPWFDGGDKAGPAAAVDDALQSVGFFLIKGHGVPREVRSGVRAAARGFFALDPAVKDEYAVTIGGRGWHRVSRRTPRPMTSSSRTSPTPRTR